MIPEETLSEIIELLESSIQFRDLEYVKEALIILKDEEHHHTDDVDEMESHYNNDRYDEIRSMSSKKKKLKDLKLKKK